MMLRAYPIQLLAALLLMSAVVAVLIGPVAQDPAYHDFADTRAWLGIPNFANVASCAGFLVVGAIGLIVLIRRRRQLFQRRADARPYLAFFTAVALVGLGSGYYHWAPSNASLLWDRLPISCAFMAISAALVADRIAARAGNGWLLAVLLALGPASLLYWDWTESLGRGDLRFYGLVQFFPMLALPVIVWAYRDHHYTVSRFIVWVLAWYAIAKLFEYFDRGIFELSANLVSGHTLKHLAAAVATWVVLRMLRASSAHTIPG